MADLARRPPAQDRKRDRLSIVRDVDTFMYERQSHETMEVGSYVHRPILVRPVLAVVLHVLSEQQTGGLMKRRSRKHRSSMETEDLTHWPRLRLILRRATEHTSAQA